MRWIEFAIICQLNKKIINLSTNKRVFKSPSDGVGGKGVDILECSATCKLTRRNMVRRDRTNERKRMQSTHDCASSRLLTASDESFTTLRPLDEWIASAIIVDDDDVHVEEKAGSTRGAWYSKGFCPLTPAPSRVFQSPARLCWYTLHVAHYTLPPPALEWWRKAAAAAVADVFLTSPLSSSHLIENPSRAAAAATLRIENNPLPCSRLNLCNPPQFCWRTTTTALCLMLCYTIRSLQRKRERERERERDLASSFLYCHWIEREHKQVDGCPSASISAHSSHPSFPSRNGDSDSLFSEHFSNHLLLLHLPLVCNDLFLTYWMH